MDQVYKNALSSDMQLEKTHPVQITVPNPEHLNDIFDNISYAKGSVICRMLNAYIGDE